MRSKCANTGEHFYSFLWISSDINTSAIMSGDYMKMNSYRTTARVVGAMYVAGFVVGIGGDMLIKSVLGVPNHLSIVSASSMTVIIGALLWMMAVAWDAAHGVLMFPILKLHNERIAVGYLAFRVMDATFIAIMVLFILLQIPLARVSKGSCSQHHLPSVSEQRVNTREPLCLQYRHDNSWYRWSDALLYLV
jgi:hypothetical protein